MERSLPAAPSEAPAAPRRLLATALVLALALSLAPAAGHAAPAAGAGICAGGARPSKAVNAPTVIGPIGDEGIRTKKPYGTTMTPLRKGWIEEEFFFEGTARSYGRSVGERAYRSRILVRRPIDPRDFNGTVIVDWNNVTLAHDRDVAWNPLHGTIMKRGFAYVSVAAQLLSVEGSPLALKQYDPVRYGSLRHPGDDYSYDIFSQAAEAVLDPKVSGDLTLCVQRRLAMGASQSASRLRTYINEVQPESGIFDGFQPQIIGVGEVRTDVAPVLWVNSQSEVGRDPAQPDGGLFRLWELAGPAHTSYNSDKYHEAMLTYSHTNGARGEWDAEDAGKWGYQVKPGSCMTANAYQASYPWSAALVALDTWVRTGKAPASQPRAARDDAGEPAFDEHHNLEGGVRSPIVDVPIATYSAGVTPSASTHPCAFAGGRTALKGTTLLFDTATLAELYPTDTAYLRPFNRAIERALDRGTLLPEGARELRRRAKDAAAYVADHTR